MLAIATLAPGQTAPLAIMPVIHPKDGVPDPDSRTFWSATANALYIERQTGADLLGPTPDFANKLAQGNDLAESGCRGRSAVTATQWRA